MAPVQISQCLWKRVCSGAWLHRSETRALLTSAIFFVLCLALLRPGYAINDDLNMIALLSGYPGGHPEPFVIFSNVLVGLILAPLYGLHTNINWEVLLYLLIHFVSVWVLVDLVLRASAERRLKAAGVLVVLACDIYFILNITFTTTAAFACLAGSSLILFAVRSSAGFRSAPMWGGALLVLLGGLVRPEMPLIALTLAPPAAVLAYRTFKLVPLFRAILVTAMLVGAAFLFDRLYIRSAPAWRAYDVYNSTRSLLHDTHRLENVGHRIRRIAWSPNDQELFARWFFPDPDVYSLERIQYLVDHVSPFSSNPLYTLETTFYTPFARFLIPYVLIMLANCLWMLSQGVFRKAVLPVAVLWVVVIADNSYFALAWKIADRMLLSTLCSAAVLGFLTPYWITEDNVGMAAQPKPQESRPRWAGYAAALLLAGALLLATLNSLEISRNNFRQQALYGQILSDLRQLQGDGKITGSALIVSPAHGLPLEWSYPFTLDWPSIPYLDTGWMTFSPRYNEILTRFAAQPLIDALYQNENIYIMTRTNIIPYIGKYYEEHEQKTIRFQEIYAMPNPYAVPGYNGVFLYKMWASN